MRSDKDKELQDYLKEGFADLKLSTGRRDQIVILLNEEMSGGHTSTLKRFITQIRKFCNTTYEVSLAPMAAVAVLLLLVVSFNIAGTVSHNVTQRNTTNTKYYVQQVTIGPDGSMRVVYQPAKGEEN